MPVKAPDKTSQKTQPARRNEIISGLLEKVFGRRTAPQTAQQSIPYREMFRDGICQVNERLYTKTIMFGDINYHLAKNDDQSQIFDGYCDFLNYFDSSIVVQMSFVNQHGNMDDFKKNVDIPPMGDGFDSIRREYASMLKSQMEKGNNGLTKTKYITFGVEVDSPKTAKHRIERVEAEILNNFKALGVQAWSLNGTERLELLHGQLHPGGDERFRFDFRDIPRTGMSTKDFIAPTSFDFRDGRVFRMGEHYGAASYVQILAPEISDHMLADFIGLDTASMVTFHIRSIDQSEAIKTVKRKLSDLDKMRIEEQKKAVRAGYDMDVLPADLATYAAEAKALLEDLQSRNERMFLLTLLILNTAKTKQKLEENVFAAGGVAQKYNCAIKRLDWQQEQGLMSSLALGLNQIEIERALTTSSVAIFIPFTTQELFMGEGAFYYGLNPLSNNLIMADRKRLKNPKGLYHKGTEGNRNKLAVKPFAALLDEWEQGKGEQTLIISLYQKLKRRSIRCRHRQNARLITVKISLCA